jgi:hypothetical protein
MSGLGPSFRRFCSSLNAQPMNFFPHAALNGRTPASILYSDRSLPFKDFLPFGCKATVLKGFAARKASKRLDALRAAPIPPPIPPPIHDCAYGALITLFCECQTSAGGRQYIYRHPPLRSPIRPLAILRSLTIPNRRSLCLPPIPT